MLLAGVGMLAFSFVLLLFGVVQHTRHAARQRALLERARFPLSASTAEPVQGKNQKSSSKGGMVYDLIGLLGSKITKDSVAEHSRMRVRFLKAGIRSEGAPAVFWGTKFLLALLLPSGILLFKLSTPHITISPTVMILALTAAALTGYYLPDLLLYNRTLKRKQIILDGFPDALDMLVVGVEAGMGMDASMQRVANEIRLDNQTLSDELMLYSLELRAGMLRHDALKNLAMRTDLSEMHNLTTLLIQTDKFGTSVSQALKVYSDSMRTQRFQRAETVAAQLPVKMLFPMILFIFPALFVVILGPGMIQIYRTLIQM